MTIDRLGVSLAAALASGVSWVVCTLIVWIAPSVSSQVMWDMLHMEPHQIDWQLDPAGIAIGGLAWIALSFLLVWLSIFIYQLLDRS